MEVLHVKAHAGQLDNERADKLAKKGVKLRFILMIKTRPKKWFERALKVYWGNRNACFPLLIPHTVINLRSELQSKTPGKFIDVANVVEKSPMHLTIIARKHNHQV